MHITLESDYAVRIVDCLAHAGHRMDARSISEETKVTLRFSLKILSKLASSGIVRSFKGVKGGYELARPAGDITLRDVIETVEGVYNFSRCLDPDFTCHCESNACREGNCRFQKAYDEITEIVRDRLTRITFEDI